MTDYSELVKALRWCANNPCSDECQWWLPDRKREVWSCVGKNLNDAAVAIEALQVEVDALKHDIERYVQMNTELLNDRPELEEIGGKWVWKEPKRGKWVGVSPMVDTRQCSICGYNVISEEMQTPYCPWCGAKMEVQDG